MLIEDYYNHDFSLQKTFDKLNTKFKTLYILNILEDIKFYVNNTEAEKPFDFLLELFKKRYFSVKYNKFGNFSNEEKELEVFPDRVEVLLFKSNLPRVALVHNMSYYAYCAMVNITNGEFLRFIDDAITSYSYFMNGQFITIFRESLNIIKLNKYKTLLHELLQIQENTLKSEYIANSKKFCWKSELSILHDKLEENEWKDNQDILRKTYNNFILYVPGLLIKAITKSTLEELLDIDNYLLVEILENLMNI